MALASVRARMPFLAFILLAIVCLALLGFACACLSDHPMQAVDRALSAMAALPALVEVWSVTALGALAAAWLFAGRLSLRPPSAAVLQRFLL
jgi:hypothetical protein